MSDSVKEVEVESSGASLLSVKKEGHKVESQGSSGLSVIKEGIKVVSQGLSGLSVKTDGSKDPPPRFDTKGMKMNHDSEEEQDTDLSQDPLGKIVKLIPVLGPSGTAKSTVISSPQYYQKYKINPRHLQAEIETNSDYIQERKRLENAIGSPVQFQRCKIQSLYLEMYSGHLTKLLDDLEQQVKQMEEKIKDKQHFLPELLTESGKTSYRKNTVIGSPEYYQRNKTEPRNLQAEIEFYHRHLTELQNDLKQIKQSKERIKTYSDYNQERERLENLHNKLGRLEESIARSKRNHRIQVSPFSIHPGDINKAPPDRPEQHPSTSESDLAVSENIREESKEDEEDQPCPDDPERSNQQHQRLCGEAQSTNDQQHFQPELLTASGKTSYRFRCPRPGVFHCEATGLVFVMVQEAELLYRTVQWDESLLRSAGKMAAGLLFDIKCSEDAAVCQLHLPHCEVIDAPLPEGLLSVVHITDDGMNFLEPLEITDTHVVVTVSHFSPIGIVRKFFQRLLNSNDMRPVSVQVLLFLGQPNPKTKRQKLNVFLLPRNIHLDEVSAQQRYSENIQVPSKCELFEDQSYTLHCPQAIKIQPKSADFNMEFGPNYFPTFEVRLKTTTEEVTLTVKDQKQLVVWEYDVDLIGKTSST
uniref:FIIND domain-containing protein n=1 Tax=Sparus aurata TaxID=8175 RepID=A0A671WL39_SPAAU